jgi:uncharacterized protein YegL
MKKEHKVFCIETYNRNNFHIVYQMDNIFKNTYIELHNHPGDLSYNVVDVNEQFGLLKIHTKPVDILHMPIFILFTLDRTGSMQEVSDDNVSNMRYAIQTMKNMVRYISKQTGSIFIQINTFNSEVDVLIPRTQINVENLDEICAKLDSIEPTGITNIEKALQMATQTLTAYSDEYPTHEIAHIFMTDGEPTDGVCDVSELTSYVNTSYPNMNIGFGHRHNVHLMRKLSDLDRSYYSFVDNAKNTSMVYGEMMHMLLYPIMKNVEIEMQNGFIYNWRNNQWETRFTESVLVGDTTKIYHVKTGSGNEIRANLTGQSINLNRDHVSFVIDSIPDLINDAGDISAYSDLTPYIFRQKVQELLYMGRTDYISKKMEYKQELSKVFQAIREYMKTHELLQDPFLCQLCDDVAITYRTCSSEFGTLYANARSIAQGGQHSYTPQLPKAIRQNRRIPPDIPPPPKLKRGIRIESILQLDTAETDHEFDTEIDEYQTIRENTSCYASPSAVNALHSFDS